MLHISIGLPIHHRFNKPTSIQGTDRKLHHSCVMTLYYLAKWIRFNIFTAISFCTIRVLHPTEEVLRKLYGSWGTCSVRKVKT
jgi:hypothetical protein